MKPSMTSKLQQLSTRLQEIDRLLSAEDATRDMNRYRALGQERAEIEPVVGRYGQYARALADEQAAQELLADPDMKALAEEELHAARARMVTLEDDLQRLLLPRDPNDERNVFLEIRAGTGGDESALFAGDLLRMYLRFAERNRWKTEMISESASDLGGYKEVIVRIEGQGAYSKLKFESGGHRVQRVPATEAQGRIHTSACTVAVLAEADEIDDVKIDPTEIRIDVYRASGAGGQHVNKTESAIRITHIPTGIVVSCQNDRSQHKNRATAWAMLRSRLYEFELEKREAAAQAINSTKTDIGWGHQIRSYVLQPYQLVKDLRTGTQSYSPQDILDGDLDAFMQASLAQKLKGGADAPPVEDLL
ncbi:MAG: peptide chain release factor 1 [Betaproteobacteria bacterium]